MSAERETADPARGGFPRGVQYSRVPSPLLGRFLEEIDDLRELKLTLRAIWAIEQMKGTLRGVKASDLAADRTVASMLGPRGDELESVVASLLQKATDRGVLVSAAGQDGDPIFYLNIEPVRRALERSGAAPSPTPSEPGAEPYPAEPQPLSRSNALAAYEANIGPVTPMIAESIQDELLNHAEADITDAIQEAVRANARNWSYVSAVLRNWAEKGRPDGEPGRHPEADRSDEFISWYLERQRARGNR